MRFPNLAAEMARIKLSPSTIARAIGKSTDTVRNYINGITEIPLENAFFIREKYFPLMPIEYLFEPHQIEPQAATDEKEGSANESSGDQTPDPATRH